MIHFKVNSETATERMVSYLKDPSNFSEICKYFEQEPKIMNSIKALLLEDLRIQFKKDSLTIQDVNIVMVSLKGEMLEVSGHVWLNDAICKVFKSDIF